LQNKHSFSEIFPSPEEWPTALYTVLPRGTDVLKWYDDSLRHRLYFLPGINLDAMIKARAAEIASMGGGREWARWSLDH
jgi:hypothetical protein